MTDTPHRNHLATETSPYLLQHAHNPVDWYPWGETALEKARREDKPILLSIGYSACHWCHVMERESFENESIAALMNGSFVNVKVDREERPDLDQIYMSAVQLMTGSGGWPLTVFLTPDGRPFYGGTYFPPEDRYNRPGFKRVLAAISEAYQDRRGDVLSNAKSVIDQINAQARQGASGAGGDLGPELLDVAFGGLSDRFDSTHGGFGPAPKFPPSMTLDFLMRYHDRTGNSSALSMVDVTLERMARGGIYDQLGGGFHRYSTDERWLVPHFEKMLYDNALLARAYLDAFLVTGNPLYRNVVEETLDFVSEELCAPDGGFYATLDADSEGVEGKYYVWSREEFDEVTGGDSEVLARYWDVTPEGNFEGQNILNVRSGEGPPPEAEEARRRLLERRAGRVRPGRDEKILTDWNGLMLRAYTDAAGHLGRDDYRRIAETNARFILSTMWDGKRLLHAFKDGRPRFNAYLDDYANLADGLMALYGLTFEERWLWKAVELTETMIGEFWDSENGAFFFTGKSHEQLVARTKEFFDNATPSGNSVAADVMARLGKLLDRTDFREKSEEICRKMAAFVERFPSGFGRTLAAVDFLLGPSREIALVGQPGVFLPVIRKHYMPRTVVAAGRSDSIALLAGRKPLDGAPTAFVCSDYVCKTPATDEAVLGEQLLGNG